MTGEAIGLDRAAPAATAADDSGGRETAPWSRLSVVQAGSSVACAFAARLLADLGATCTMLDPPAPGAADAISGGAHLARGKRRVTADLATDEGLRTLKHLAAAADVVIRDRFPRETEQRWRSRAVAAPRRIELLLTPYGDSGPYRDWLGDSGAMLALAGLTYTNGDPSREPLTSQPDLAEYFAGAQAFLAILTALRWRARTGRGTMFDLGVLDAAIPSFDGYNLVIPPAFGVVRRRFYSRVVHGYPSDIFACRDGHVALLSGGNFPHAALLIERPDLIDSPLFQDRNHRSMHWRELEALLVPWLREHDRDEVVARAQELRLTVAPVLTIGELIDHPHVRHRGSLLQVGEGPDSVAVPAPPFRLASSRGASPARAAVGAPESTAAALRPAGVGALPLSGIRVLDFSQIWAGPQCGRLLGDLGADVIKIEGLGRFDSMRSMFHAGNDPADDYWNHSLYFQKLNPGKRSLAVDLTTHEGREIVRRLVIHADVVIENFTPRVMKNFGLDHAALSVLNERIVMLSMSGYGSEGPFAHHGSFGLTLDASSGLSGGNGYTDGPPATSGTAFLDGWAGVLGAAAVVAALAEVDQTGVGQFIDFSQHEAALSLVGSWFEEWSRSGQEPQRLGNRSARHAPQGIYACAGDDEWIYLSIRDDEMWTRACKVLGDAALGRRDEYAGTRGRRAQHDALDGEIAALTARWEKGALMHALQAAGVLAAAVLDGEEVLVNEQLLARATFERGEAGIPPRPFPVPRSFAARPDSFALRGVRPAPKLGEHNHEILRELAGYTDAEVETLERDGVVGVEPRFALPIEQMRRAVPSPVGLWLVQGVAKAARGATRDDPVSGGP